MNTTNIKCVRLSPEGKGVALIDNKPVYIENLLPGEEAEIEVIKNKHYTSGNIIKITKTSEARVEPKEDHYMICSPLQFVDYKKQIELKKDILENIFADYAKTEVKVEKFIESEQTYGYRNKLEFSITFIPYRYALAFNERESRTEFKALSEGCSLGSEKMNTAALKIIDVINTKFLTALNQELKEAREKEEALEEPKEGEEALPKVELIKREDIFKKLIIRESKTNGQIHATLLVKTNSVNVEITLADLENAVDGLVIGYSLPNNPVASIDKIIYTEGIKELEEKVGDKKTFYPYNAFFQNNIEVFNKALEEIRVSTPNCKKIVELYCGVGSIGLNLADKAEKILASDTGNSAVRYAQKNAWENEIKNYSVTAIEAEKLNEETLSNTDVLVVDPPRAGLHESVIAKIIESKPKRIIYLSCDAGSQARDFTKLKELYKIDRLLGFDFYPQTPNMESLLVLDLK